MDWLYAANGWRSARFSIVRQYFRTTNARINHAIVLQTLIRDSSETREIGSLSCHDGVAANGVNP
jgi:hypothetical protein